MKRLQIVIWSLLVLFFLSVLFSGQLHHIRGNSEIPPEIKEELLDLAARSLKRSDVPVGSVLTYEGRIIGSGYNTVMKDDDPAGHAEVNAIREAMRKKGYREFMQLDRGELVLYSTFDPCEMCMGTLQHYNIQKVVYMKEKPLLTQWRQQIKEFYYKTRKRKAEGGELQDSLFMLHPDYPKK